MEKKDLKTGMWVELRNGKKYMVLTNVEMIYYNEKDFALIKKNEFVSSQRYNNNLINEKDADYDIMKVYANCLNSIDCKTYTGLDIACIWERPVNLLDIIEASGYKEDEINVDSAIGVEYEINSTYFVKIKVVEDDNGDGCNKCCYKNACDDKYLCCKDERTDKKHIHFEIIQ